MSQSLAITRDDTAAELRQAAVRTRDRSSQGSLPGW